MGYVHEQDTHRGYPHSDCVHCGKEVHPTRKCECKERQPDGAWGIKSFWEKYGFKIKPR